MSMCAGRTAIWTLFWPRLLRLAFLREYTSPAAFKECQKVISAHILPHAHRFEMVARSLRGVPVVDWRSDAGGFTISDEIGAETGQKTAEAP